MSHSAYHCCCLCDERTFYGGIDIESKDCVCTYCAVKLAQEGIIVRDIKEFVNFISTYPSNILYDFLVLHNLRCCWYENNIDDLIKTKIGIIKEFERE